MSKKDFSFIERRMSGSGIKGWYDWIVECVNPETSLFSGRDP